MFGAKTKVVDSDSCDRYAIYILDGWRKVGWVSRWEPPMNAEVSLDFRDAKKFDDIDAAFALDTLNHFGVAAEVFARTETTTE